MPDRRSGTHNPGGRMPQRSQHPYNPGVARSSASFRRMTLLALAAMLLAVVMPTASRILAATTPDAPPLLVQMCTAVGLKTVALPAHHGGDGPAPAPALQVMDEVCGYCVLATALPLVLLLLCLLALRPQAVSPLLLQTTPLRLPRNFRGLGSQAPPIAV